MRTKTRTIAAAAIVMIVVLSLAVSAAALPRATTPITRAAVASGTNAEQKLENLRNRITNVLRARKARFDAVIANLVKRQARVEALAGKVEALGGGVSKVRTMLQECEQLLEQARAQEQVCVEAFHAVPEAPDKRSAFRAAKAEGRQAVELLKQSRVRLREAARELRIIAEQLREVDES